MIFPGQCDLRPEPAASSLFDIVKQGRKGRRAVQFMIPFLAQSSSALKVSKPTG
jgi:hypothetical protein